MFYNDVIFQSKVNENYYWGKFKINLLNFGIFQYQDKNKSIDDYIKTWFNLTYSKLSKDNIECKIQIVTIKDKINNVNELYFDFVFDQETKFIKAKELELYSEIYTTFYNQIHTELNINLENDYDSDELEYKINRTYLNDKVENVGFKKYLTRDGSVRKKYENEVNELESKYNACLESALYKMYEEDEIQKFNYMKDESFIKLKIENSNKKLHILEFLTESFSYCDESLHDYCLKKYATQLCRKFKYTGDNLTKIRYNFIVTNFDVKRKYQHNEIKIEFESLTGKIKGSGKFVEGGNNKSGTYSKIDSYISNNDEDSNYEFDENIGDELIDYITYQMRNIGK